MKKIVISNNKLLLFAFLAASITTAYAELEMKENGYYIGKGHATKNGSSGKFTAPTDLGAHEIRYFSKRNGTMLAKRVFVVR